MGDSLVPLVVCLGNEHRGDDAVGLLVADQLKEEPAIDVVAHRGDGLALIELWCDRQRVILVDAITIDRAPGSLLYFDVSNQAIDLELGGASTHAFGPGGAIELARTLGQLPERVEIVAVAARHFAIGASPTEAVTAAVPMAAQRVRELLRENVKR